MNGEEAIKLLSALSRKAYSYDSYETKEIDARVRDVVSDICDDLIAEIRSCMNGDVRSYYPCEACGKTDKQDNHDQLYWLS